MVPVVGEISNDDNFLWVLRTEEGFKAWNWEVN